MHRFHWETWSPSCSVSWLSRCMSKESTCIHVCIVGRNVKIVLAYMKTWGKDNISLDRERTYLPTEDIPDFTSTICTNWGLDDERVPEDTTELIFHPSVTTIKDNAFNGCTFLVRVTIPDHVTHIGDYVLSGCNSLTFIRLPRNLISIGIMAFCRCTSLEAVYFPPTVIHIGNMAFRGCISLRICYLPEVLSKVTSTLQTLFPKQWWVHKNRVDLSSSIGSLRICGSWVGVFLIPLAIWERWVYEQSVLAEYF